MLIGMAIDTSGQFPEKEMEIFGEFGKEIRNGFAKSIAETKGSGKELILKLGSHPMTVNTISIMEDITKDENIRKYSIEAWEDGRWKAVCDGVSVGHKRIQQFNAIKTEKLRLSILQTAQKPVLNQFAAYYVEPGE